MQQLLLTSFIISLAAVGFRAITDKGMIFYFLRKPFDDLAERDRQWKVSKVEVERLHKIITENNQAHNVVDAAQTKLKMLDSLTKNLKKEPKYADVIAYLGKPFILCSTCMGSVHTLIWYPFLTGSYAWDVLPAMLIVATMNTLVWAYIQKIQR